jgi:PST family polysaccharide transporter
VAAVQVLKFFLNLATIVVLTRYVSPREQGLVFTIASVTGAIGLIKELGLPTAMIQRATITRELLGNLFWLNAAGGVGAALLIAGLAPSIASFFGEPRLATLAPVWGLGYLFEALGSQHDALLRRRLHFRRAAAIDGIAAAAGAVLGMATAVAGCGGWALVWRQLGTAAARTAGLWMAVGWKPGWPGRESAWRETLRSGGGLTGESVITYLMRNIDNVLIARCWGSAEVGLYARAYSLLLLPIAQIVWPLQGLILPLLARLRAEPGRYRAAFLPVFQGLALASMCGGILTAAVPAWVTGAVFGAKWAAAIPTVAWLGLAAMMEPILNATTWLFISQGRTRELVFSSLLGAGGVVLAIVIGLAWKSPGVAAGLACANLLWRMPLLLWWSGRTGAISSADLFQQLKLPAMAAVLTGLAAAAVHRSAPGLPPLAGLLLATGLSALAVMGLLFATGEGRRFLSGLKFEASLFRSARSQIPPTSGGA